MARKSVTYNYVFLHRFLPQIGEGVGDDAELKQTNENNTSCVRVDGHQWLAGPVCWPHTLQSSVNGAHSLQASTSTPGYKMCMTSEDMKPHIIITQPLGGGDSSVVRAPDSWLKGRGFESLLERRENFLLQGRLSVLTLISVSVPPPCYHKSAGGRLQLNTHTPYVCGFYWTVLRHWSQLVPNMSNDIWGH